MWSVRMLSSFNKARDIEEILGEEKSSEKAGELDNGSCKSY